MLAVLMVVLAFNSVDRVALGLVLQDIKLALHLSDTQLGVLSGIAFALFYSIMGVPIARWADRGNRVAIISVTTALWSAMVALCGSAASFAQLLLIRVGVAVGEAGCVPPAHSLIADFFSRAERPRAVALYMLGGPLSMVIGYFVAGWLNEFFGWRTTFVILGLPGLVLALVAWFTLKEPRCVAKERAPGPGAPGESPVMEASATVGFGEVCTTLWRNATFRNLLLCNAVISFFTFGIMQWQPAFFIRSYGLKTGELGTWFAVIYGLGGMLGTFIGGEWASRRAANNEELQLKVLCGVVAGFGVLSVGIYLAPNLPLALGLLGLAAMGAYTFNGPLFATIQTLVPENMRATSIALFYLFANLVGMGLGPLAAGAMSDFFRSWAGEESLRYSLLALSPGYFWSAWHLWRASIHVTRDLAALHPDQKGRHDAEGLSVSHST
jgi:MFS family permease